MHLGLHVKQPLFESYFNENYNFLDRYLNNTYNLMGPVAHSV